MATYTELKERAKEIKLETRERHNTAMRVGSLLEDAIIFTYDELEKKAKETDLENLKIESISDEEIENICV
jgi:hypothetical protein